MSCGGHGVDPEDFFITKDGKQYPDDEFLTEDEVRRITLTVLAIAGESPEEHDARVARAIRAAESDRRRAALQRRRKAKEACFECPLRLQCLEAALDNGFMHGTWGGYYEEEIRELRREIARRKRATRS